MGTDTESYSGDGKTKNFSWFYYISTVSLDGGGTNEPLQTEYQCTLVSSAVCAAAAARISRESYSGDLSQKYGQRHTVFYMSPPGIRGEH